VPERNSLADSRGRPLCEVYDAAFLDLDGVVYVGPYPVPHAAASLHRAAESGMNLVYVTNNASRTPSHVVQHLRDIGMPAKDESVVTSAQAAAGLARQTFGPEASALVIGAEGLRAAVREYGLREVSSAEEGPDVVLQGFGRDVAWSDLAEASFAVGKGVPWIATNTDQTVPTPRGLAPGNGTLVAVVVSATGIRPTVAGKPEAPLFNEAVKRTGAVRPLMVGDRMDTDIQGASAAGLDSLLVLTGATDPDALVRAPAAMRPSFVAEDLRGLLQSHPAVDIHGSVFGCGGWQISVHGTDLVVDGSGGKHDGLRAVCAAAWSHDGLRGTAKALSEVGW